MLSKYWILCICQRYKVGICAMSIMKCCVLVHKKGFLHEMEKRCGVECILYRVLYWLELSCGQATWSNYSKSIFNQIYDLPGDTAGKILLLEHVNFHLWAMKLNYTISAFLFHWIDFIPLIYMGNCNWKGQQLFSLNALFPSSYNNVSTYSTRIF